jgi:hypothetical protein
VNRKIVNAIALGILALVIALSPLCPARAQDSGPSYERMVPIDQYLIADRNAEIARFRYLSSKLLPELVFSGLHNFQRREQ